MHGGGVSIRAIARTLGVDRKQVRVSLVAAGSLALQQSLNSRLIGVRSVRGALHEIIAKPV